MFMKGLFSVKKGEKLAELIAPVNGTVIPESDIPDVAFASGMLGHGFGIIPSDGEFYSPINGVVIDVTPTKHAYSIKSDEGAEILIHIGIDTVELKGKGFISEVARGDKISVGTPLAHVELDTVNSRGLSTITAVIIINHDELSQITVFEGICKAKETTVMSYVSVDNKKQER